jgi:hypothetical protein
MRYQIFSETLTHDRYILDIVTNGYKIEFCTEPFQIHPRITLVPKLLEKRERNMHLLIPNWSENRPSELKPELSAKFPS